MPETNPAEVDIPLPDNYDELKRAYASNFAATHMNALRPHYQMGETLGQGPEVWRNVSEHCLVSGIFADILAEELGLDPDTRKQVVTAALLHDWDKKHESQQIDQMRKEGTLTADALDGLKHDSDATLLAMGFDRGTISLLDSNVPKTVDGPSTTPAKILWYVDAMLSNTEPVRITDRFTNLLTGWDGKANDPVRAQRNDRFSRIYEDRYGMPLYDLQIQLGEKVGAELAEGLGYTGPVGDVPLYLRQLFVNRVLEQQAETPNAA